MAARKKWSYKIGPYGATVTVEERKVGGSVRLKSFDSERNGYVTRSLKYSVRDAEGKLVDEAVKKAKKAASDLSNRILHGDTLERAVTFRDLAKLFRREELPKMGGRHRKAVKAELALLEAFLGPRFEVEKLGPKEWNALARQRASGEIDAKGVRVTKPEDRRPVGPRTVAKTLKTLRQVCRFGSTYRTPRGSFLLSADPTRGLSVPSQEDPNRPMVTDEEFEALVKAADKVHPFLRSLLVIAGETGRRIGAVVALRYGDWLPDRGSVGAIRWRADSDKLGREWIAPVTPRVREEIERILSKRPGIGEAFIFPAPDSDEHVDVTLVSRWWRRCEKEAELGHETWRGWHSLRRRWATKRKDLPLTDVAAVGGWVGTQVLRDVYQRADWSSMEEVVVGGRELRRA